MADESNVLFVRGNENEHAGAVHEDIWDDTALIKAYDKAVTLAKEEVAKRMGMETQTSQIKQKPQNTKQLQHASRPYKKWTIGSPCRAVYSDDGEIYEATITKIYENSRMCIVKFIGYGNSEKVELSSLLESEGLESQIAQQKEALKGRCDENSLNHAESILSSNQNFERNNGALGEKMECETDEAKSFKHLFTSGLSFNSVLDTMPPAPPLPPQLMAKLPENDADALSSMLMSWYISGFHTGYYHGLKQARINQEKRKNC